MVIEKGELHTDKNGNEFLTVGVKKCFTFGWKDTLNKIVSKVNEIKEIQSKVTARLMKKLEEHDRDLRDLKRKRREDKKKLEIEIDKIKADYLVKPSVKLKQFQEDFNEMVSDGVKKVMDGFKKTFKIKDDD